MRFYCASITPGGMRLAGEIGDGNLPIFMSPETAEAVAKPTLEGMAKAGKPAELSRFDIAPYVKIRVGADLQACRDACKPELALYIGGMGARGKNFYNDYCKRLGYADAAAAIQDAYLAGRKQEAAAAVPDALVDEIALVGPADRIRGRLQDWKAVAKEGKVGTLVLTGATQQALGSWPRRRCNGRAPEMVVGCRTVGRTSSSTKPTDAEGRLAALTFGGLQRACCAGRAPATARPTATVPRMSEAFPLDRQRPVHRTGAVASWSASCLC